MVLIRHDRLSLSFRFLFLLFLFFFSPFVWETSIHSFISLGMITNMNEHDWYDHNDDDLLFSFFKPLKQLMTPLQIPSLLVTFLIIILVYDYLPFTAHPSSHSPYKKTNLTSICCRGNTSSDVVLLLFYLLGYFCFYIFTNLCFSSFLFHFVLFFIFQLISYAICFYFPFAVMLSFFSSFLSNCNSNGQGN